jgi:hypothetical protein
MKGKFERTFTYLLQRKYVLKKWPQICWIFEEKKFGTCHIYTIGSSILPKYSNFLISSQTVNKIWLSPSCDQPLYTNPDVYILPIRYREITSIIPCWYWVFEPQRTVSSAYLKPIQNIFTSFGYLKKTSKNRQISWRNQWFSGWYFDL